MRRWFSLVCLVPLLLAGLACQGQTTSDRAPTAATASTAGTTAATRSPAAPKLVMAASTSVLADLVQNVGGDRVDVRTIVWYAPEIRF